MQLDTDWNEILPIQGFDGEQVQEIDLDDAVPHALFEHSNGVEVAVFGDERIVEFYRTENAPSVRVAVRVDPENLWKLVEEFMSADDWALSLAREEVDGAIVEAMKEV
jgi:hypothetical protein